MMDLEYLILVMICCLASLIGGLASLLTNGRRKEDTVLFDKKYTFTRLLTAISIGFPTFFIAHQYIEKNEFIIVIVWIFSFISDQALPIIKEKILQLVQKKVDTTIDSVFKGGEKND